MLAAVLLGHGGTPAELPPLACPTLAPRIATADRIELAHAGQVTWLERRGMVWGLARQGGYPVQPGRADALLAPLMTLRLVKRAPGPLDTLGLADPFQSGPDSGTSVRVLANSGAILCAIVTGSGAAVRRPADAVASLADPPLTVSANADSWSQHTLPPIDPALIRSVAGDDSMDIAAVGTLLAALPFTDIRPRPQVQATTSRTMQITLTDGTAVLTVGTAASGQSWLTVSGTAPWASRLAPYAFALPAGSPLIPT